MKKHYWYGILIGFAVPLTANAQQAVLQTDTVISDEFPIDEPATPPEEIADAIITFIPAQDYALHIPLEFDYYIEGSIVEVKFGDAPRNILMHANTLIMPLEKGMSYQIMLKYDEIQRDAGYPIHIMPSGARYK